MLYRRAVEDLDPETRLRLTRAREGAVRTGSRSARPGWRVLAAAAAGFLVRNWPPAKLFMGDVGSGFLGIVLGVLLTLGACPQPTDLGGPGGGDDSEEIEVHVVPLDQVDAWLDDRRAQGLPLDPKIYTALYWLNQEGGEE